MPRKKRKELVKLADVAREAGVSVSTASMALANNPDINNNTRNLVHEVAKDLKYRPLRERKKRVPRTEEPARICFFLVGATPADYGYSNIIFSLAARAPSRNCRFEILHQLDPGTGEPVPQLGPLSQDLDAIILSGQIHPHTMEKLRSLGIPCLLIGHHAIKEDDDGFMEFMRIVSAEEMMGHTATRYLFDKGHQVISCICWNLIPGLTQQRFVNGYRLAHLDHGVSPDLERVFQVAGDYDRDMDRAVDDILRLTPTPSAFVIPDSRLASEFVKSAEKRGLNASPANIVIMDNTNRAEEFGVNHFPLLAIKINDLVETAFFFLDAIIQKSSPPVSQITLPFYSRNFHQDQ